MNIFMKLLLINIFAIVNTSNKLIKKAKIVDPLFNYNKINQKLRYLQDSSNTTEPSISSSTMNENITTDSTMTNQTTIPTTPNISIETTTPIKESNNSIETTNNITEENSSEEASISITESTINNNNGTNPTELKSQKLLLGYDNYNYKHNSDLLTFFTYVRYLNMEVEEQFNITITIKRKLRALDDENENNTVICELITNITNKTSPNDEVGKYNCTANINDSISRVVIIEPPFDNTTELEKTMRNNLQDQNRSILSDKGFILLNECIIDNSTNKHLVNCSIDSTKNYSLNNFNVSLHIIENNNNNNILEVPANINKNKDGKAQIQINYNENINTNLNNTLGTIKNRENIYLLFNAGENSNLSIFQNNNTNEPIIKKKSRLLSAGAIVGIILPCVVILIGITAAIFFFGKKNPTPPIGKLDNNSIEFNSSSNVVN